MAIAAFPFFSHSFRVAVWIERAVPQLVTCSKDCALPLRREHGGRPPSHSELSGFCAGTVPAFMSVPGKSCHAQLCKDRTPVLHSARLLAVEIRCLVSSLVILFPRCFILLCICVCEMCSSKHKVSRHPQALYSFKDVLGRMSAFLIYRDCSGHHSPFLPPLHHCPVLHSRLCFSPEGAVLYQQAWPCPCVLLPRGKKETTLQRDGLPGGRAAFLCGAPGSTVIPLR